MRYRFELMGFGLLALAGCGLIEPAQGDMQAALRKYAAARYGGGAQIEYLTKTVCLRRFSPAGYLCRFQISTNTALPRVNQGFFYYHDGWQVRDLTLDAHYPM